MRVLIFAAYYLPHLGGYTLGIHEVAKGLIQRGCHVEVIACNTANYKSCDNIDGVIVYRLFCWNLFDGQYPIPNPFSLARFLFRKYDVISTQTRFFPTSFLGALFAKLKSIPHIHTERGAAHSVSGSKLINLLGRCYDHTFGALTVKMANINVGVSDSTCEFLRHLGGKHTVMIRNGVYESFFDYNSRHNNYRVVYAGRLVYGKGVQDLIRAFGDVRLLVPMAKLIVVGDGNYRGELEKQSGGNGLVQFVGERSPDRLAEILASCDVFVHPSYSEGMPSSIMEASAVGLPVVATDVGGSREIIDDGKTGFLVKSGDIINLAGKISLLLSGRELSRLMGEAGRQKMLAEYRWADIIDDYATLFQQVTKH